MRTHNSSHTHQPGGRGVSGAAIIFGFSVTVVLTLIAAGLTAIFVYFTALSEMSATSVIYYTAMLCAAAGAAAAGKRAGRLGWLHGGAVGLLYALGSSSASYAAMVGPLSAVDIGVRATAALAVGVLGGIIGMNL